MANPDLQALVSQITAKPADAATGKRPEGAPDRQKLLKIAQEFEAMMLSQTLKEMRRSLLDPVEENEGLGLGTMTDTVDIELGRQLSQTSDIGVAAMLLRTLETTGKATTPSTPRLEGGLPLQHMMALPPRQVAPTGIAVPSGTFEKKPVPERVVDGATVHPTQPAALALKPIAAAGEVGAMPLPISSAVTSSFGWRADPFDGHAKFHGGVDLRAAYGKPVPAAAAGTVVSAGTQGGYGLTVVIQHENGIRTRYAHLSTAAVTKGEVVADGQSIGGVGQSGRATGPHLHFEVTRNGQRLNPVEGATLYARLKNSESIADSPYETPLADATVTGTD